MTHPTDEAAKSMAIHDAETRAQALEDAASTFESGDVEHSDLKHKTAEAPKGWTDESIQDAFDASGPIMDWLRDRAQTIRSSTLPSEVQPSNPHHAESDPLTREERHALVEGAVAAILPNAVNETQAYNIWNNLASDERFVRAIVTFDAARRGARTEEPEATAKVAVLEEAIGQALDSLRENEDPDTVVINILSAALSETRPGRVGG